MSTPLSGALAGALERRSRTALLIAVGAGTLFCISIPRIGPLFATGVSVIASLMFLQRDIVREGWLQSLTSIFLRPQMLLVIWVAIACLWAVAPLAGLAKATLFAALVVNAIVLSRGLQHVDGRVVEAIAHGLLIGLLLGGLYLLVDITWRDAIGKAALTYFPELDRGIAKHGVIRDGLVTSLSGGHITRVALVFVLFACPAALAVSIHTTGIWKWLATAMIVIVIAVVLLHPYSRSQTAQLALGCGLAFVTLAKVSPAVARWLAGASFTGAVFLMVPLALAMFAAKLHENPELFKSARARVVMWNFTAERVLEHPYLGVGTYSTRYLDEIRMRERKAPTPNMVVEPATRAHPHNVYLQVWYELGIIGALAFAVFGLSLLRRVTELPQDRAVFAIGHFAVCMTVILSSYGLWQNWFQCAIILSIVALVSLAGARGTHPQT